MKKQVLSLLVFVFSFSLYSADDQYNPYHGNPMGFDAATLYAMAQQQALKEQQQHAGGRHRSYSTGACEQQPPDYATLPGCPVLRRAPAAVLTTHYSSGTLPHYQLPHPSAPRPPSACSAGSSAEMSPRSDYGSDTSPVSPPAHDPRSPRTQRRFQFLLAQIEQQNGEERLTGAPAARVTDARTAFAELQAAFHTLIPQMQGSGERTIAALVAAVNTTPLVRKTIGDKFKNKEKREKDRALRQNADHAHNIEEKEADLADLTATCRAVTRALVAAQSKTLI